MKKLILLIVIFLSCQFAYADLDENFDYMNISTESFKNFKFKKTTMAELRAKYPTFKPANLEDGQVILVSHPRKSPYSEIRVGFNKNVVEWVEFILKEKADLDTFISCYGETADINKDYNETYDYYNYGYFNISTDKEGKYLYSITIFDTPKIPAEMTAFDKELPSLDKLKGIQNFIPNEYLEETFSDDYDCLYPKFNKDGTKTYTVKDNIVSKYSKVEFIFKDGLLKFLILYPKNVKFENIVQLYGKNFKIKQTSKAKIIYDYGDFSAIADIQNKILQIAID